MNDEPTPPTPPVFFRPAAPKRRELRSVESIDEDGGDANKAESVTAFLPVDSTERRYTLGEALKIVSGLHSDDMTTFMLIVSTLEAIPAKARKRIINTLSRFMVES